MISFAANWVKPGTGCRRAAGVVTTTVAVAAVAAGGRRALSFERTVRRSLDAAKASRMSRLSGTDSGKMRVGADTSPFAPLKSAMSSASCSADLGSSVTTIHTGAPCLATSSAMTAPWAGAQTPVTFMRISAGPPGRSLRRFPRPPSSRSRARGRSPGRPGTRPPRTRARGRRRGSGRPRSAGPCCRGWVG